MRDAYQKIASRIGISGAPDDARPYTFDGLAGIQPATPLDPTCAHVLATYTRKRIDLNRHGFHLGRPALALLTQPFDGRGATRLRDMEFYDDLERAAWRPWIAVERLAPSSNFSYASDTFVTHFSERDDGLVDVHALDMRTRAVQTDTCRTLVMGSGALGTARIVLRSRNDPSARLPLLCNPYTYVPCIVPSRIGKAMPERNIALCQLVLFHDPGGAGDDVAFSRRSTRTVRSCSSVCCARCRSASRML